MQNKCVSRSVMSDSLQPHGLYVACHAPLSTEFCRPEYWSGLPFPSPMHESESEVSQSCPTLSDLMDCSPPGSSVHGIFQGKSTGAGCHCILMRIAISPCIKLSTSIYRYLQPKLIIKAHFSFFTCLSVTSQPNSEKLDFYCLPPIYLIVQVQHM